MRNIFKRVTAVITAVAIIGSTFLTGSAEEKKKVGPSTDFYQYINRDWLEENLLSDNELSRGGFSDLAVKTNQRLSDEVTKIMNGTAAIPSGLKLSNFTEFLKQGYDIDERNLLGVEPVEPYLKFINEINTVSDLTDFISAFTLLMLPAPISVYVSTDFADSSKYSLFLSTPTYFLPSREYYSDENYKLYRDMLKDMMSGLLLLAGENEENIEKISAGAMEFDRLVASYSHATDGSVSVTDKYNPLGYKDFVTLSENIDLNAVVTNLLEKKPEMVVVTEPDYFLNLDKVISEDNLEIIKNWLYVNVLYQRCEYLSKDFFDVRAAYDAYFTGAAPKTIEKGAYDEILSFYSYTMSYYYGEKFMGKKSLDNINEMIKNLISTYKNQIKNNEWMSKSAKKVAIKKLNNMNINVGYFTDLATINAYHDSFSVKSKDKGGTYFSNIMETYYSIGLSMFSYYDSTPSKNPWVLDSYTVNAGYAMQYNSLNFPASIFEAPFYSENYSDSRNYGGIGAIIAHEISHAFDPTGSQFDQDGNYNDWWTEKDKVKYKEIENKIINHFDGIETEFGKVSGLFTADENMADLAGLTCAIEAAKELKDYDAKKLFLGWATIWRQNVHPIYGAYLLEMDEHAPNKVRVNNIVQLIDEFYEAFGTRKGHKMYVEPENRIKIW